MGLAYDLRYRDHSLVWRRVHRLAGRSYDQEFRSLEPEPASKTCSNSDTTCCLVILCRNGKASKAQPTLALHFILGDHAVFDVDDAVGVLGDVVLVRHQYDRVAFGVQAIEQRHDLVAGL